MGSDFQKAADRARAREQARKRGEDSTELAEIDDTEASVALTGVDPMAVMSITPAQVAANLASGKWKAQPQIMKLKRNVPVLAFLEGPGPDAELNDPREGKKLVGTWILRSLDNPGVRVSILTAAQLDKKLPGYVGDPEGVCITRLEEHDTASGGRVTDYVVCGAAEVVDRQLAEVAAAKASR